MATVWCVVLPTLYHWDTYRGRAELLEVHHGRHCSPGGDYLVSFSNGREVWFARQRIIIEATVT